MDLYRTKETAPHFRAALHALKAAGMPVAITEFGCATYQGAAERGAVDIVEYERGHPIRLKGEYERDEAEQARLIAELVNIFEEEGVDSAFLCTFACFFLPHQSSGQPDLDLASFGIVRVHSAAHLQSGGTRWSPKIGFTALALAY